MTLTTLTASLNIRKNKWCNNLTMLLVNNEDYQRETERERQKRKMIFLSWTFSVCSPSGLSLTPGRQQESDAGDRKRRKDLVSSRNGTGPENVSQAPPPFRLPMSISPLEAHHRHTLLLHPWLLPWQLFVFQRSLSEEDCLSQSSNNPFSRTNVHTHKHTRRSNTVIVII